MSYAIKQKVKEHYDVASPLYKKLWGNHIHHGYYITGSESKKQATENLIKQLVKKASVKHKSKVLDVGCGIGGTSIWLSKNLNCDVTGITISPVQVKIADKASMKLRKKPKFLVMDANNLNLKDKFDIIWAVEVISHLSHKSNFFRKSSQLLKKSGKICIGAWLKADNLTRYEEKKYIKPIEEGMLCSLLTLKEYFQFFDKNNLKLIYHEDASAKVKKTWDLCLDIIKDPALWKFAANHGNEFLSYLKSFRSMKRGYDTGKFRYALMIVEKC